MSKIMFQTYKEHQNNFQWIIQVKKTVFSFNINEIILKKIKKKMNKNRSGAIG